MSALHEEDRLPGSGDDPKLTVRKTLKRIEDLVIASEGLVDEEHGLAKEALEFLRAEIIEGRLAMVDEITRRDFKEHLRKNHPHIYSEVGSGYEYYMDFCPGCGSKVIEG
jgi:hypothetical protein